MSILQEFQAAKKEGSGFMTRVADSFHNMSASYMTKNRPSEFVAMGDYINTFSEKLGVLDRISQRVIKEQYGLCLDYNHIRIIL
jgi:sorting nexin-7/30